MRQASQARAAASATEARRSRAQQAAQVGGEGVRDKCQCQPSDSAPAVCATAVLIVFSANFGPLTSANVLGAASGAGAASVRGRPRSLSAGAAEAFGTAPGGAAFGTVPRIGTGLASSSLDNCVSTGDVDEDISKSSPSSSCREAAGAGRREAAAAGRSSAGSIRAVPPPRRMPSQSRTSMLLGRTRFAPTAALATAAADVATAGVPKVAVRASKFRTSVLLGRTRAAPTAVLATAAADVAAAGVLKVAVRACFAAGKTTELWGRAAWGRFPATLSASTAAPALPGALASALARDIGLRPAKAVELAALLVPTNSRMPRKDDESAAAAVPPRLPPTSEANADESRWPRRCTGVAWRRGEIRGTAGLLNTGTTSPAMRLHSNVEHSPSFTKVALHVHVIVAGGSPAALSSTLELHPPSHIRRSPEL